MKKIIPIIFIFLFCINSVSYQTFADKKFYLIDSLDLNSLNNEDRQILDSSLALYLKSSVDTIKLDILNNLCENLESKYWEDYQELLFSQLILRNTQQNEAIKSKIENLLIDSYNNMALINLGRNNLELAAKYVEDGLLLASKYNNEEATASLLNNKGGVFVKKNQFDEAMSFFNQSLEIRKKTNDPSKIANSINNIGNILIHYGENEKALQNFKNGLKIQKEINDVSGIIFSQYNIASVYRNLNQYDSAISAVNRNIIFIKEQNLKSELADNLELAAKLYLKSNDILNAVNNLNESLEIRINENNKEKIIKNKYLVASSYYELGLFDKSLGIVNQLVLNEDLDKFPIEKGKVINLKIDLEIALYNYQEAKKSLSLLDKDSNLVSLFFLKKGTILLNEGDLLKAENNLLISLDKNKKKKQLTELELHDLYYTLIHLYYEKDDVKCLDFCDKLLESKIEIPNNSLLFIAQATSKYGEKSKANTLFTSYFEKHLLTESNSNQIYELAQNQAQISQKESQLEPDIDNESYNWSFIFSLIINVVLILIILKLNKKKTKDLE